VDFGGIWTFSAVNHIEHGDLDRSTVKEGGEALVARMEPRKTQE